MKQILQIWGMYTLIIFIPIFSFLPSAFQLSRDINKTNNLLKKMWDEPTTPK
jgi:hypothetical protein